MPSEASLKHGSVGCVSRYYPLAGGTHDKSMTDSSSAAVDFRVSNVSSEGADDETAVMRAGGVSSAIDFRLPDVVVPDAETGLVQTVGGAVNGDEGFPVVLGE